MTNLGTKQTGSPINIEMDILGKYALKLLGGNAPGQGGGLTQELLLRSGF